MPGAVSHSGRSFAFAIKAAVSGTPASTLTFTEQKTMYDGKHVARGDAIFVFASEIQGGKGLIARGIVTSVEAIPRKGGIARQTLRVSLSIACDALAKRPLGRLELKRFNDWTDGQPGTELNFKFYRQATNKLVGLSENAAAYLDEFF